MSNKKKIKELEERVSQLEENYQEVNISEKNQCIQGDDQKNNAEQRDVGLYGNPLEDLKRSYARGEIDKEEYLVSSQKIEKERQQRLKEMLENEKENLVSDAALKLGKGEITVAEFQQRVFGDLPEFKDFYKP